MKRNNLIENLTNFLVLIITLYAAFLIIKHIGEGLFAIFYAILLILISAIIYFAARDGIDKLKSAASLQKTIWGLFFLSFSYLLAVFIFLII